MSVLKYLFAVVLLRREISRSSTKAEGVSLLGLKVLLVVVGGFGDYFPIRTSSVISSNFKPLIFLFSLAFLLK
jgi:hypothetical protein